MSRLLALSSNYDLPTRYVSAWIWQIVEQARSAGHEVLHLANGELTEGNLYGVIEQFAPEFVVAGGHGNADTFTGMNLQPLIVACLNDQVLAGSQVLFASCLTGIQLVPSVVSKGGLAAAGFTSEFTWVVKEPYNPYTDPYAAPFGRLIVEPAATVLRGGSWSNWYSTLKRIGAEERSRWGNIIDDPMASQILLYLQRDVNAATYMTGSEYVGAGGGLNPLVLAGLLYGLSKVA